MKRRTRSSLAFAALAAVAAGSTACSLGGPEDGDYSGSYDTGGGGGGGGGCPVGNEGCPCTSGGKCNDPFLCNPNLNICISDTCPVGSEGCLCTGMGAC